MMHEEICTYEVCKLAKERGFLQHIGDDAYIADNEYYDDTFIEGYLDRIEFIPDYYPTVTAPTQSLLQRWLREEKMVYIEVYIDWHDSIYYNLLRYSWRINTPYSVGTKKIGGRIRNESELHFDTYELALEDALKYALENLV